MTLGRPKLARFGATRQGIRADWPDKSSQRSLSETLTQVIVCHENEQYEL
jgi:hypothetical protein